MAGTLVGGAINPPSLSHGRRILGLGDMAGSDASDAEKDCSRSSREPECKLAQIRNEADREEGRVTDDEHASCSDHVSVEGGIGSDISRPGSGTWDVSHLPESCSPDTSPSEAGPPAWSYPTFALTPSDPKQERGVSQADEVQQIKLARLLLSRGKVGKKSAFIAFRLKMLLSPFCQHTSNHMW